MTIRGVGLLLQTKANYSAFPAGVPSAPHQALVEAIRGPSVQLGPDKAFLVLRAAGPATLGAAGSLWLCRYSAALTAWVQSFRITTGLAGSAIALDVGRLCEQILGEVLPDSLGFDLYDAGGGALGSDVDLVVGRLG